jgi:hypothetical protein
LPLGLTPRLWQLYEPTNTLWWLGPSTDWPAYRHGKFAFSLAKDAPRKVLLGVNDSLLEVDTIFAGVNIDKGYGYGATVVAPTLRRRPAQIIDRDWLGCTLVEGNGPARFGKRLGTIAASETVYMYVVSSYAHDRESHVQADRDAGMFRCHSVGITAVLHNRFPVNVLCGIDEAKDFSTLASRLRTVDDYHWVDIYVGTHVVRGDVDVDALYKGLLSRLDEWVVEVPARS